MNTTTNSTALVSLVDNITSEVLADISYDGSLTADEQGLLESGAARLMVLRPGRSQWELLSGAEAA